MLITDKKHRRMSVVRKKLCNFCKKDFVMAVYVKAIPTLRGSAAERFVKMSEENLRRRASVDFSKEAANSYAILKKKEGNK